MVLAKGGRKASELVGRAIIHGLSFIHCLVRTIIYENGKEFAEHALVDRPLGLTGNFADLFASWQKGSNKNSNGVVRQYITKKQTISSFTDRELALTENSANNQLRKRLGLKASYGSFLKN